VAPAGLETEFSTVSDWMEHISGRRQTTGLSADAVAEADYIHQPRHFEGTLSRCDVNGQESLRVPAAGPDGFLRDYGPLDYYDLHLRPPECRLEPGMGRYRQWLTWMGHRQFGRQKTLLLSYRCLFGGLWGGSATPTNGTWRRSATGLMT